MATLLTSDTSTQTLPRYRWTSEEFKRIVDQGILREDSRAFLWDGEIYEPMARKRPHINADGYLLPLIHRLFPAELWTVDQDSTLFLDDGFEPQPDLMVLRGPRSDYRDRVPTPADVVLLIEFASTTYAFNAGAGLRGYARACIDPYWIVNLPAQRFEVYQKPDRLGGRYAIRTDYPVGTSVPCGEGIVAVSEVLR